MTVAAAAELDRAAFRRWHVGLVVARGPWFDDPWFDGYSALHPPLTASLLAPVSWVDSHLVPIQRRQPRWPVLATASLSLVAFVVLYGIPRFRVAVEIAWVLGLAVGAGALWDRWSGHGHRAAPGVHSSV